MRKQSIIIIILIIVIALLVAYIFFGQYLFQPQASQSEALTEQEKDEIAGAHPSDFSGETSQQGGVPDNSSEVIIANDNEDFFADPNAYAGRQVKVEGTVYNNPSNNQGILAFNIKTDSGNYAFINYLDVDETMEIKNGDKVKIFGVATNEVQIEDDTGNPVSMIMINASSIEITD